METEYIVKKIKSIKTEDSNKEKIEYIALLISDTDTKLIIKQDSKFIFKINDKISIKITENQQVLA